MADAKKDNKNNQQKEPNSEGFGFKRVMGGFDVNEVNLYINKLRKQMKEQETELERRISNLQANLEEAHKEAAQAKSDKKSAEQAAANASAPIIKDSSEETKKLIDQLKAESDKKIMELRKSVLDERRNVAKFDKECAMAKMSEKKVREEYDKLKEKYHELKKKGGGASAAPGKAVATSNADEVMAEAGAYAKEIIAAAKNYAQQAVMAADKYKADVEAELKERSDKLARIKEKLDAQIKQTQSEQAASAAQMKDFTGKIGSLSALFESFAQQFDSVNSQINGVTSNIDNICRQFSETSGQISSVAQQINDTTSQIDTVSRQISETSLKINDASKKIGETTEIVNEASRKMNGFTEALNGTKSDIDVITRLVDDTKSRIDGAKTGVAEAQAAASSQVSSADLSPIAKIGEELTLATGALKAKFELPKFDDSKFSDAKFDAIRKKFRIETRIEQTDAPASEAEADDDDEFEESDIISSISIDSPDTDIPSDDDLMADMPDVITPPIFEETPAPEPVKPAPAKAAAPVSKPDLASKTERPGLDSDFEDFFLTEPKDDDMSGEIPLINMEGVGVIDDFNLDATPDPISSDFDITPIDKTARPTKGNDLGADIYDMAIDPTGTDDDTLANMMADADEADRAANVDLTPADLNFREEDTLPTGMDDFGEFADLFAAGSSQTVTDPNKRERPSFRKPTNNESWNFGGSDSDDDLSSLLI